VPKASREDNFNKPSEDLGDYQLVEAGDLVINKMKAWQGSVAISQLRGIVSPAYFIYTAIHLENPKFIHYLLRSMRYVGRYLSISKGIRPNQWDLEPELCSRIPVLVPPREEQDVIAAFLDDETAKIDALVAEQERLIELLKEKRQAVSTDVVTKGLNLDAPMKDSGIEWIEQIPAHWELRRISTLAGKITNGYVGPTREIFVPEGIPYLQSLHIKGNRIIFDVPYFVSRTWSEDHGKSILRTGDVLVVQTGDIGQAAVVSPEFEGCNCHALIVIAPLSDVVEGFWLSLVLTSAYGNQVLRSIQTGALHPHLNCGDVKDVVVPVPPLAEQRSISRALDRVTGALDSLLAEAQRAIQLLQERRAALISAAVTGQIDVRPESMRSAA
jgi:type I restriction enzyme S subunit